MTKRMKSTILVVVQFAMLAFLAATGPWLPRHTVGLFVQLVGLAVGLWAVLTMRVDRVHVFPEVRHDATLLHHGPYRFIRHPMYLSLLLITLPLVVTAFSAWRLAAWLALLVNLLLKLHHEERLLVAHFPGYAGYQAQTSRLLPWMY